MKAFFEAYAGHEKLQPLVGEIAWTDNLVIMERCKEYGERELERALIAKMTRTSPSASSCAKKRAARLWSTPCTTPASPSV